MTRSQKVFAAKAGIVLAVPTVILAYAGGPPAKTTGAPGERVCTACHNGTLNSGGGMVAVSFADGNASYSPGVTKRVRVQITDSAALVYGFEMSARIAANPSQAAGTFAPSDATTKVLCEDDNDRPATGCPAATPLEYIEHAGPFANLSTTGTYEFDWVAPTADSGSVTFFVAAVAANGNRAPSGDHVYIASLTIPSPTSTSAPVINDAGVVNAAGFGGSVTTGSWVSIYGQNLAGAAKTWDGLIVNGVFPTSIDGVSVTVNGKAAPVNYISPSQINVQSPDDSSMGPVAVQVTNANGTSNAARVTLQSVSPGLFTFPGNGKRYVSATLSSQGLYYGSPDLLPGVNAKVAAPGDVVELWGTGFGPTQEPRPIGSIVTEPSETQSPVTVQIGSTQVAASYSGLVGAGLYQINVAVPDLPDGEYPVVAIVNGVSSQAGALLQIQH
jgi:uncharacterized protein (TIGR03437 family)